MSTIENRVKTNLVPLPTPKGNLFGFGWAGAESRTDVLLLVSIFERFRQTILSPTFLESSSSLKQIPVLGQTFLLRRLEPPTLLTPKANRDMPTLTNCTLSFFQPSMSERVHEHSNTIESLEKCPLAPFFNATASKGLITTKKLSHV